MRPRPRLRARVIALTLIAALSAVLVPAPVLAQQATVGMAPGGADAPAAAPAGALQAAAGDAAATSSLTVLPPAADADVSAANPTDNFGAAASLRVAGESSPAAPGIMTTHAAFIYFNVASLPTGTEVLTATLSLYQVAAPTAGGTQVIYAANSSWQEDSVTWGNAPKGSAGPPPLAFETPQQSNVAVALDVTAFVQAWLASPTLPNKGFALLPAAPAGLAGAAADASVVERVYSSREGERPPLLTVEYRLPPVRVCHELADPCTGIAGAEVYDLDTGAVYLADATGAITRTNSIALGHRLWARARTSEADANGRAVLYRTTAQPIEVTAAHFTGGRTAALPVPVTAAAPLHVVDLNVSAQWYVEGNPAVKAYLSDQLAAASAYLYAFTDGQFALGTVAVRQNWEGWQAADLHLYANNVLRPKAVVGGNVLAATPDISTTVPISYYPGPISMGAFWNRYAMPPGQIVRVGGQIVPPETLGDDWALALAHELGHWLLFLFDTYSGVDGTADGTLAELCTGTAMGDVYLALNHGFIFDHSHWDVNCAGTEAHARLNGRTEWETIAAWYPGTAVPASFVAGPDAPALTKVVFVPPTAPVGAPANDPYTVNYQDGEAPTDGVRAFLIQGAGAAERVVEQGKPSASAEPGGAPSIAPVGAVAGDYLCVYDIRLAADPAQARHQFGCEQVAPGDYELALTKDVNWAPQIAVEQTGAQQVRLEVVQTVAAGVLKARLYPEDGPLLAEVTLAGAAAGHAAATVDLGVPVPPLYVRLFVDETVPAPATRREVMTDRGAGGGGAFGPKRLYGGAPIRSADGNATFEPGEGGAPEPGTLEPSASIAWQSMGGTPPLPADSRLLGPSYRLDAYPPALVEGGTVSLKYAVRSPDAGTNPADPAVAGAAQSGEPEAAVYYWNGSVWEMLPTVLTVPVVAADGDGRAGAPSRGPGVYAVLGAAPAAPVSAATYLPLIQLQH